jgi:hypothetical protein
LGFTILTSRQSWYIHFCHSPTLFCKLRSVLNSSPSMQGCTWLYISRPPMFQEKRETRETTDSQIAHLLFSPLVITEPRIQGVFSISKSTLHLLVVRYRRPCKSLNSTSQMMRIPKWNHLTNCVVYCYGNAGIGTSMQWKDIPRASSSQAKFCYKLRAHHSDIRECLFLNKLSFRSIREFYLRFLFSSEFTLRYPRRTVHDALPDG